MHPHDVRHKDFRILKVQVFALGDLADGFVHCLVVIGRGDNQAGFLNQASSLTR